MRCIIVEAKDKYYAETIWWRHLSSCCVRTLYEMTEMMRVYHRYNGVVFVCAVNYSFIVQMLLSDRLADEPKMEMMGEKRWRRENDWFLRSTIPDQQHMHIVSHRFGSVSVSNGAHIFAICVVVLL